MMVNSYPKCRHEETTTDQSLRALTPRRRHTIAPVGRARGMTLVELLAVVTIVGILSTVAIARLGSGSLGRPGVMAAARRLALDLRHTRSLAITKRINHYARFDAAGYTIYRRDTPTDVAVDARRTFPQGVTAVVTASDFEYEPTGAALATYTCELSGSGVTYRVKVIGATGTTTVKEL